MVKKYDEDELYAVAKDSEATGRGSGSYKTNDTSTKPSFGANNYFGYGGTYAPYGGSQWDSVRDSAAKQLVNMNYTNWTQGDQYKALANRYAQQGQLAMRDVLGQVADRTGGLASSYATAAAQQQYNGYMQDLEAAAREMYGMERNQLMDNAQLAQSLSQEDYGRYLDALNQHNTNRNFAYNTYRDEVSDWQYSNNMEYQKKQDDITNTLNQAKFDHDVAQDALNKDAAVAEMGAAYGDFSGYEKLGFSKEKIAKLEEIYKEQGEAAAAETAREWLYKIAQIETPELGETAALDDLKKTLSPAPKEPDYGASFNPIWTAAKTMYYETPDVSEADIVEFLEQFGEDRLTAEGLDYIMSNLFFGGYRGKEA